MHGIDSEETFAPVAKMTTVWTVIVVAPAKGQHLHQMDVKNAFLQGKLEEEVYMIQPPGFESRCREEYASQYKNKLKYSIQQYLRDLNPHPYI